MNKNLEGSENKDNLKKKKVTAFFLTEKPQRDQGLMMS